MVICQKRWQIRIPTTRVFSADDAEHSIDGYGVGALRCCLCAKAKKEEVKTEPRKILMPFWVRDESPSICTHFISMYRRGAGSVSRATLCNGLNSVLCNANCQFANGRRG